MKFECLLARAPLRPSRRDQQLIAERGRRAASLYLKLSLHLRVSVMSVIKYLAVARSTELKTVLYGNMTPNRTRAAGDCVACR